MTEFHQVKINGTVEIPEELIEFMNNGKSLSLYIDGILSHVKPNGKDNKVKIIYCT